MWPKTPVGAGAARTRQAVADPAGWLVRATARFNIDRPCAEKAERCYRDRWMPETLIGDIAIDPVEQVVFLLHEAFDADNAQIAQILGRSEAACGQLASRARTHVQEARPRFQASDTERPRASGRRCLAGRRGRRLDPAGRALGRGWGADQRQRGQAQGGAAGPGGRSCSA